MSTASTARPVLPDDGIERSGRRVGGGGGAQGGRADGRTGGEKLEKERIDGIGGN